MAKLAGSIKPWASAANHVVGDYPGEPTKVDGGLGVIAAGFIPGDVFAPTAEETNFELNRYSLVLQWVQDGTNANDATAHIVETNSSGDISVRRGLFTTNLNASSAVDATASGTALAAITANSETNGVVVLSTGGSAHYCFSGTALGGNAGGHRGVGAGSGRGGYFTGGATAAAALQADATGTSPGFIANGAGGEPDIFLTPTDNFGFDIQCGSGSLGNRILANGQPGLQITQDDPDGTALLVSGDGAATSGTPTFESRAFGAGNAARLQASSGTGYCLSLVPKTAAPSKGAIQFGGQNARPTTVDSGQIAFLQNEGAGHFAVSCFADFGQPGPGVGWRGVWTTTGGMALARGYVSGPAWFGLAGTYEVMVTMTAAAGNAPKLAGRKGIFRLSFSPRVYDTAALQRINVRVRDVGGGDPNNPLTPGTDIFLRQGAGGAGTAGIYLPVLGTAGYREPISLMFSATIPAAGDRAWNLALSCTDTMDIRDPCLELIGLE